MVAFELPFEVLPKPPFVLAPVPSTVDEEVLFPVPLALFMMVADPAVPDDTVCGGGVFDIPPKNLLFVLPVVISVFACGTVFVAFVVIVVAVVVVDGGGGGIVVGVIVVDDDVVVDVVVPGISRLVEMVDLGSDESGGRALDASLGSGVNELAICATYLGNVCLPIIENRLLRYFSVSRAMPSWESIWGWRPAALRSSAWVAGAGTCGWEDGSCGGGAGWYMLYAPVKVPFSSSLPTEFTHPPLASKPLFLLLFGGGISDPCDIII